MLLLMKTKHVPKTFLIAVLASTISQPIFAKNSEAYWNCACAQSEQGSIEAIKIEGYTLHCKKLFNLKDVDELKVTRQIARARLGAVELSNPSEDWGRFDVGGRHYYQMVSYRDLINGNGKKHKLSGEGFKSITSEVGQVNEYKYTEISLKQKGQDERVNNKRVSYVSALWKMSDNSAAAICLSRDRLAV